MDVKEIRGWFEAYALDMGRGAWHITDDGIDKAAAEIAKLFDQQLQSEHEEIRIRTKREVGLQAQLAEMRELIETVFDGFDTKEAVLDWHKKADKALSAAPEVLFSATAPIEEPERALYGDVIVVDFKSRGYLKLWESGLGRWQGQQGHVILIRKRDDEEPKP